jgi:hypothetical protein
MDIESAFIVFFGSVIPALLIWQAAHGRPRAIGRAGYLIGFSAILAVDGPTLLVLYVTPKRTPAYGVLAFASDLALVLLPVAFGCLISSVLYGKVRRDGSTSAP